MSREKSARSHGGGMRGPQRPKSAKRTIGRILKYMAGYKISLSFVVVGVVGSALAGVAGTYFLKPIINSIADGVASGNFDVRKFAMTLFVMGVIYAVGAGCTFLYNRLMLNISTSTMKKIRVDMFKCLQALPIKYYDTHTHGEIMSRFSNDTDTLREMLSQGMPQLLSSSMTVVGVFSMMLVLSPVLTLLIILMLFVMLLIIKKIGSKSASYFIKQQRSLGAVNGYIEEMIEGQKVVKVFCREDMAKEKFEEINEELFKSASNAHTFASILMPIMNNLSYVNYALTATAGATLAIYGALDIGTVASFLQYTRSFSHPITQLSQQFNSILNALAGAERIFELMDSEPERDEGDVTLVHAKRCADGTLCESAERTGVWAWKQPCEGGTATYTEVKGDVRFEDVVFGYEENKEVLRGISLYAKPGQKIAFVGSTGAGKTTITNLINRFYDVPDGKITFDGININKIKKSDLRRSLGMVLQDTHLFTETVRENIRYGKLDATDEEVERAAKIANAHSFISHLPNGYDTVLTSDGVNLSQGQRQLIAIARAAVADPPVLILDEATSSVDTRTEALIEKGMDTLMEGRTVFVIAHRLSTVRNSQAILVLENGKIIERGTHDDLLALQGKYHQLYTGMFELE